MRLTYTAVVIALAIVSVLLIPNAVQSAEITLTIIYDNYVYEEGTYAAWGFSCIIEGTESTILFDTGWYPFAFEHNCDVLGIDLSTIDTIVLSHDHPDHVGNLDLVLGATFNATVYFGESFSTEFEQNIVDMGAIPVRVREQVQICNHVYSTGELPGVVPPLRDEQSLIVNTIDGMIVITGCSHPGIVYILETALYQHEGGIDLVFGGFHLVDHQEPEIWDIIGQIQVVPVETVGASHCTGDLAIQLFQAAYGENFEQMGTGKVITATIPDPVSVENGDAGITIGRHLELDPAYPNPFNPQTTIKFALDRPQHAEVAVYTLTGKQIAVLADRSYNSGDHSVIWNGNDAMGRALPSGTYVVRLETESGVEARKVMLIR